MAEQEKQSFLVQAEDGRKFKMVIRGDLNKIPVDKIKRYLKQYGVPDGQTLTYEGQILHDDMHGEDFGLTTNSVLHLWSGQPVLGRVQDELAASRKLAVDVEGRQRQSAYEQQQYEQRREQGTPGFTAGRGSTTGSTAPHDRPRRSAPDAPLYTSSPQTSAPFGTPTQSQRGFGGSTPSSGWPGYPAPNHHAHANGQSDEHPLQRHVAQLESENSKLRREVDALKLEIESKRSVAPVESLLANAKANLHELGKELGLHLVLDQTLCCVIGNNDAHTLIVTFDAPTERLYVYSTLLNFIPQEPATRLRLFEVLLEGALLGRDIAGGGIGASLQSGVIIMATSIPLRHCGPGTLREIVPAFVEALVRWRSTVAESVGLRSHE